MKILVINCGSSSLKYQLIDMENELVMVKGLVERIGLEGSVIKHEKSGVPKFIIEKAMRDHTTALESVLTVITDPETGVLTSMKEIDAIGHRVVHGGEKFSDSVVIDESVIEGIEACIDLAPLHNPPNLMGIQACREILPQTPMVAVFDTAFHQTIPPENYIYPLPYEYYQKYKIRKYGFHGTSHKYVAKRAAELMDMKFEDCNIITCHLGNGASLCAIEKGKSIDTSMGFTPLAGLAMGTRTGDLDPAITTFLMQKEGLTIEEINNIYNKKSGILGISGLSSDFRDVEKARDEGNERAGLALKVFVNRVKRYIGGYIALLEHVDAIVFTAGLGENSPETRQEICDGLQIFDININDDINEDRQLRGKESLISYLSEDVKVFVIPTNEELMIARDTLKLIG